METGYIHSIETMGLVDGPGIRTVIFMQGCDLRCVYCHNPDTWEKRSGKCMTSREIVDKVKRFRSYYDASGGGITLSGGEPLMQPEFTEEVLKLCKDEGINTCIDTAGYGNGKYRKILENTDLILYDVKHYEREKYKEITGRDIKVTEDFLKEVENMGVPLWIRHVVVPKLTDSRDNLDGLKEYVCKIPNVEKVELLPYHLLGAEKYDELGIPYKLNGIKAMDLKKVDEMQKEVEKWVI